MSKLLNYLAFAADPQSLRCLFKQMKRTLTEAKGPSATALIGATGSGKNFVADVWVMMLDPKGPTRENGIFNTYASEMEFRPSDWMRYFLDKRVVFIRSDAEPLQQPDAISMLRSMMSSTPLLVERPGLPAFTGILSPHLIFVQQSATVQVPCVKVYLRSDPEALVLYDQLHEKSIDYLAEMEHLRQAVMAS